MFQPQVHADDLSFSGAEALLAHELPGVGTVPPERILEAAASEPKLLDALARETFRSALIGCKIWMERGYDGSVSVNIPISALRQSGAADELAEIAHSTGVPPQSVVCELTEDAMYASSSESLMALAQMRMAGFGVALDDIGQRSSGLLQVSKLPLTELKIDRELIVEARRSDKARSIIASLANLGRELSMKVVAEGVETAEDLAFVRANRIDCVQGYLISKKLSPAALMDWLESRNKAMRTPRGGAKERNDRANQ
jgi:EAL domain-containing protein (putative c-di-GMP-specific phosphodiesterase class I)